MNGFHEALRYELEETRKDVTMTNFYPYYIDTGLFKGFKPSCILSVLVPILKVEYTA